MGSLGAVNVSKHRGATLLSEGRSRFELTQRLNVAARHIHETTIVTRRRDGGCPSLPSAPRSPGTSGDWLAQGRDTCQAATDDQLMDLRGAIGNR
jgi:hypothetical protein